MSPMLAAISRVRASGIAEVTDELPTPTVVSLPAALDGTVPSRVIWVSAEDCGFDLSTRLGRRWLQEGQKASPSALLFPQFGQIMDRPRPLIPGPRSSNLARISPRWG